MSDTAKRLTTENYRIALADLEQSPQSRTRDIAIAAIQRVIEQRSTQQGDDLISLNDIVALIHNLQALQISAPTMIDALRILQRDREAAKGPTDAS